MKTIVLKNQWYIKIFPGEEEKVENAIIDGITKFIKLHDADSNEYIVNVNEIVCVREVSK